MLSATTHDSRDSIAARIAIVNASGKSFPIVSRLKAGTEKEGSLLLIVYKSPIVFTFILRPFTIAIPTITAIREPGIVLLM